MYTFEEYKQEALGNEELHREYEAIQLSFFQDIHFADH